MDMYTTTRQDKPSSSPPAGFTAPILMLGQIVEAGRTLRLMELASQDTSAIRDRIIEIARTVGGLLLEQQQKETASISTWTAEVRKAETPAPSPPPPFQEDDDIPF